MRTRSSQLVLAEAAAAIRGKKKKVNPCKITNAQRDNHFAGVDTLITCMASSALSIAASREKRHICSLLCRTYGRAQSCQATQGPASGGSLPLRPTAEAWALIAGLRATQTGFNVCRNKLQSAQRHAPTHLSCLKVGENNIRDAHYSHY